MNCSSYSGEENGKSIKNYVDCFLVFLFGLVWFGDDFVSNEILNSAERTMHNRFQLSLDVS